MGVELSKNQIDAVKRLRSGSVLCGGVGSGKSRTSLSYYFFVECKGRVPFNGDQGFSHMKNPKDLYIITTAKKRDSMDWERECSAFNLDSDPDYSFDHVKVTIDSWNNISKYCNVVNAFFIFDEQRVVGSGSWVKSFLQITKKNRWILLSATPGDTWSDYIPIFIANGFYRNRSEFVRRHVVYNRFCKFPKIDRYLEIDRLIKLRDMVVVYMEYDKPNTVHTDYETVDYDKELYTLVADEKWNIFLKRPIQNKSEWVQALRKIVNSDISRLEATRAHIKKTPRLIIFYSYDYELELLRELCQEMEVNFAEWNGHKHMPIPNTSQWVYLVQYTAGAEGWECIETDTILFYSLCYSYKATVQARGRVDRFNTPFRDLYMIHLVSDSSIDKAILKCLKEKRNFNLRTDI